MTDYGNGIITNDSHLYLQGKDWKELGYEDIVRTQRYMSEWTKDGKSSTSASRAWANKLANRAQEIYPAYLQEQYQAQMQEYMGMMAEAMNREEPAVEPLKAAQETMTAARNDTARKQLLRRGLMSTMTRYNNGGTATRTKLGA
jgi:succinate dehydrogenase/fumarate reductase flavoprotein subunit